MTIKLHAVTENSGCPVRLFITAGHVSDCTGTAALANGLPEALRETLVDKGSPMWTLHFVDCERLSLSDLHIDNNRKMPNTDGVVIDGCRDVHIRACTIRTADDGIVLKTSARLAGGTTGPCDGIHVENCVIESRSCALKLGTESFAPFRNIVFEDIDGTMQGAINLFATRPGDIANIVMRRLRVEQDQGPLGTGLCLDLRPTRDDRFASEDAAGRINAWRIDASGKVIGLVDYPDGMPRLFACALEGLTLDEVNILRPSPLPSVYNTTAIVETSRTLHLCKYPHTSASKTNRSAWPPLPPNTKQPIVFKQ